MILLHHIVQVFAGSNSHAPTHESCCFQFPNRPVRSSVPVQSDHARCSIVPNRLPEEPLGGSHIAVLAEQEVDGLPEFIDRTIQIRPPAFDLYVRFVTSPGAVDATRIQAPTLFQIQEHSAEPSAESSYGPPRCRVPT